MWIKESLPFDYSCTTVKGKASASVMIGLPLKASIRGQPKAVSTAGKWDGTRGNQISPGRKADVKGCQDL